MGSSLSFGFPFSPEAHHAGYHLLGWASYAAWRLSGLMSVSFNTSVSENHDYDIHFTSPEPNVAPTCTEHSKTVSGN